MTTATKLIGDIMNFKGNIISAGNNAKTIKGDGKEYVTAIFYGTPFKLLIDDKEYNSCPLAEKAMCFKPCLNTAGRGGIFKKGETTNTVQDARKRKTTMFYKEREKFLDLLFQDITKFENKCIKSGVQACVRLNGTTDIQWEKIIMKDNKTVFDLFPNVVFYDYTKIFKRDVSKIKNYSLTWSYSQANTWYSDHYKTAIKNGLNIAVVFRKDLPKEFLNLKVIDGDKDDLRFLDPKNVVVGLKAKGKARKDNSGFVIN